MEWWQSGLFALLGVIAGGLFTYLGLRYQLNQQEKLDTRSWRRDIRREPLLKLRTELSVMATKQDRVAASAHKLHTRFGMTEEEAKAQLQTNIDDINTYIFSGVFNETVFMQYDRVLVDKVEEILNDYRSSFYDAVNFKDLKSKELREATEVFNRNKGRIIEIQELINQRLEAL